MSFWCHRLDKNTNEIFSGISALASKKRLNQKNTGTFIIRKMIENINVNSFFEFDLFLEASAEILNKIVGSFEINWPLSEAITIGNEQY